MFTSQRARLPGHLLFNDQVCVDVWRLIGEVGCIDIRVRVRVKLLSITLQCVVRFIHNDGHRVAVGWNTPLFPNSLITSVGSPAETAGSLAL